MGQDSASAHCLPLLLLRGSHPALCPLTPDRGFPGPSPGSPAGVGPGSLEGLRVPYGAHGSPGMKGIMLSRNIFSGQIVHFFLSARFSFQSFLFLSRPQEPEIHARSLCIDVNNHELIEPICAGYGWNPECFPPSSPWALGRSAAALPGQVCSAPF